MSKYPLCDEHGAYKQAGCEGCQAYQRAVKAAHRDRMGPRAYLVMKACHRARKAGMEATIEIDQVFWPSHCPILGTELDYDTIDRTNIPDANNPSIDRWDNSKGYVAGNVAIISRRANTMKSNATIEELRAILNYMETTPF